VAHCWQGLVVGWPGQLNLNRSDLSETSVAQELHLGAKTMQPPGHSREKYSLSAPIETIAGGPRFVRT
jgi:hypothetical protein